MPPDTESPLSGIRERLSATIDVLRAGDLALGAYSPADHDPLVSFDGLSGCEEVDRYWVNAPYAFVSINFDTNAWEHRYHVVEPALSSFERTLLERLLEDTRDALVYHDDDQETEVGTVREQVRRLLSEYGVDVDRESYFRIVYYLDREFRGYGRIDPLMRDPNVEDISCDGYELPIFVYHDEYTDIETNVTYGRRDLDNAVVRLAQRSGRHVSIGEPIVETTLPDGSRAELVLGEEVTPRGSAYTIRKYADKPLTPVDLIEYDTFSVEQMAYLWLAIENNKSLVFAGGTASGKTTSMNAVSMFIPPRSKVLTIEDTRELSLYHDNWLANVTREGLQRDRAITMYDLLRSALRHRPEYIIVGEVRGEEAITLFQAMNTGHTTYSTMHADSVQTVINRLENEPINVPRAMVQALDIVCVQTLTWVGERRVRRSRMIAEIEGIDSRTGDLDYSPTFTWDPKTDGFDRRNSSLLEEIRDERGWTREALLSELKQRERVLSALCDTEIVDYREFTSVVNEYQSAPERVLSRLGIGDEPTTADARR